MTKRSLSTSPLTSDNDHRHDDDDNVNPVPDFTDVQAAYDEPKTTYELIRAAVCFKACQYPWVVANSRRIFTISTMILPQFIVNAGLKATFYGQFCAGEDSERIRPTIQKLKKYGIGSILDYAAEDDGESSGDDNVSTDRQWTSRDAIALVNLGAFTNPYKYLYHNLTDEKRKKILEIILRNKEVSNCIRVSIFATQNIKCS